jgi:hypothetical protein
VLALDLHRGACFTAEAGDRAGLLQGARVEELDRDDLVELQVPRRDDRSHAA